MTFSVFEPTSRAIPVVVEVPHAGLRLDARTLATLVAPVYAVGQDADLYVDELYAGVPDVGATLIVAHGSRYVCDLNRGERDIDALAVEGGTMRSAPHGLIWRSTTEDRPVLRAPLDRAEFERRLTEYYRPYHGTLAQIVERTRERFGYAILVCGHSMPSRGRAGHTDPGRDRADVVPGTRGRSTSAAVVVTETERVTAEFGWSLTHDDPYRGGFTTGHYGRPREGIHSIQIELARRLYMDETTLTKLDPGFARTSQFCSAIVERLGDLPLG
jgi:N-formylglutamate amidohydrolase